VDGVPVRRYMHAFAWNEAKCGPAAPLSSFPLTSCPRRHPARRPLRETAEKLAEGAVRLEEELKLKVAEYGAVKAQLGALTRKTGGSLATRDLSDVLAAAQAAAGAGAAPALLVDSEHLATLLVCVPQHGVKDWRSGYESLAPLVVPRSSRLLAEEADLALFSVVLFKKSLDAFKAAARDKGYTVREPPAARGAADSGDEAQRLTSELATRKGNLEEWCRSAFGEAFAAQMHCAAVRLFVESILRYGLPPCFAAALVAPQAKSAKRLRQTLVAAFGRNSSSHWRQREEDAGKGEEVFPYVSVTVTLP